MPKETMMCARCGELVPQGTCTCGYRQELVPCNGKEELDDMCDPDDELVRACIALVELTAPLMRRTAGSDEQWERAVRQARAAIAKANRYHDQN